MELFYKWAKKLVQKHKEIEEAERLAHKNQEEAWRLQKTFLLSFTDNYVRRAREAFEAKVNPEFIVGEIAYTNWYAKFDAWEGNIQSLQNNCPFKGPIQVEIISSFIDTNFLVEELHNMISRGDFDSVVAPYNPELFDKIANKRIPHLKYPPLSWAYTIKIPNDNEKYWSYSFREKDFLKSGSPVCKMSLDLWKKDARKIELNEELEKIGKELEIEGKELRIELDKIKK